MIVQVDADAKDAVLSLCQTDILAKLQNPTSDIDARIGAGGKWVFEALSSFVKLISVSKTNFAPSVSFPQSFIRSMAGTCSSLLPACLTQAPSATSCWWSSICAFGR